MKRILFIIVGVCLAGFYLTGCGARQPAKPLPHVLAPSLDPQQFESAVDNLLIVLDASSSMDDPYKEHVKYDIARKFVQRFNQILPELGQTAGLRTFGHSEAVTQKKTMLVYGMGPYDTAGMEEKLLTVDTPGGTSPLHEALSQAKGDLNGLSGSTALLIVSDGQEEYGLDPEKTLAAAESLKKTFGSAFCIYTVVIGDDEAGTVLLERVANAGGCGTSVDGYELLTGRAMDGFIRDEFLTVREAEPSPAPVAVPADSDGDGVADDLDKCEDTPKGVAVDADGCPPVEDATAPALNEEGAWVDDDEARFEFDKAAIQPEDYPFLNQIAEYLNANPKVRVDIHGHTDSIGTKAYNQALSVERAESVKKYLSKKGVDAGRMSVRGFNFSKPAATNDTAEGRAKNRRVEIFPIIK